jgi:uncharacterized protein (TIGR04255 family)
MTDSHDVFRSPPIDEVLIAVAFAPVPKFQAMSAAELWQESKSQYPQMEERPPVIQTLERFDNPSDPQMIEFPTDYRRYWLLSADGTRLMQLQRDFFAVNWRKQTGDEVYPGFEGSVRPMFEEGWSRLVAHIANGLQGEVVPLQCEVTYINMIPKGEGWTDFGGLSGVISPWSGKLNCDSLPHPERVALSVTFLRPDVKGRVAVAVNPGTRKRDDRDIIRIAITSRVLLDGVSPADLLGHIDGAHDWAGRAFAGMADPEIMRLWGAECR